MKRKYLVWLHVLVWALLVVNNVVGEFTHVNSYPLVNKGGSLLVKYIFIALGFHSVSALCFYGSYGLVSPLFVRKCYWQAAVAAVLLLAALIGWRYVVEFLFFIPVLGFNNYSPGSVSVSYYINNVFWYYYPTYFIYGLMYFLAEIWIRDHNRQEALQKEKLITELAFLRSQINPHFLFNTINDIYALTYQRSEQAPEALLKLSEMLRYMLREGAGDLVPLQSEIDYLHNLIELQRIGAKGNAYINFEIKGQIGNQQLPSLLFIAFIENAFKHGILTNLADPVNILLNVSGDSIELTVSNKISHSQKDTTGGIGLQNVKRRLELLYPQKHALNIESNHHYVVHLKLNL